VSLFSSLDRWRRSFTFPPTLVFSLPCAIKSPRDSVFRNQLVPHLALPFPHLPWSSPLLHTLFNSLICFVRMLEPSPNLSYALEFHHRAPLIPPFSPFPCKPPWSQKHFAPSHRTLSSRATNHSRYLCEFFIFPSVFFFLLFFKGFIGH